MDVKGLIALAGITRGRISPKSVFQDFVAFAALQISNAVDPVHRMSRAQALSTLFQNYTAQEQAQFMSGFADFIHQCQINSRSGHYEDLLGLAYFELGLGGRDGQNFSPHGVGAVLAKLCVGLGTDFSALPEQGYFTVMDPACGSGILALTAAEHIASLGFNLCQHMVIQANDVALRCVHMSYVQLSCYGIPAVVIHGDTLTLKEYSRWYTPAYILENWVWRCPMPFAAGRSLSDEQLKMMQDPAYLAIRRITWPELFQSEERDKDHDRKRKA